MVKVNLCDVCMGDGIMTLARAHYKGQPQVNVCEKHRGPISIDKRLEIYSKSIQAYNKMIDGLC